MIQVESITSSRPLQSEVFVFYEITDVVVNDGSFSTLKTQVLTLDGTKEDLSAELTSIVEDTKAFASPMDYSAVEQLVALN